MNWKIRPDKYRQPRQNDKHSGKARTFISGVIAIAALLGGLLSTHPAEAAGKPNIVLILADDLDATTSEYWERATNAGKDDPLKKTRALIKNKGMTFTNAFAPIPICCPARATLLTGKHGHNTGVLTNGGDQGGWRAFQDNEAETVAFWLQNAGYNTALIGKYMNGIEEENTHVPVGWSEWYGFVGPHIAEYAGYLYEVNEKTSPYARPSIVKKGLGAEDYSTDYVSRKTAEFINRAELNDEQPFFLMVTPTAPHLPLPPARRHANHPYKDAPLPQRPNFNEEDLSDKPLWLQLSGPQRKLAGDLWNPIDYRLRQGSLYALDDLVENVVNTLQARGELDNTFIIFMSDNGYNLGAHRLWHKMAPYEESIRVPMVVRGPGIAAGSTRSQMVLETDIAPTLAEWAGLAVPNDVDGRSLKPLLNGPQPSSWRSDFLMQYLSDGALNGIGSELPSAFWWLSTWEIPTYSALREGRYKFVEWTASPAFPDAHGYELYDLQTDPYEMDNLLGLHKPFRALTYRNRKIDMLQRMYQLKICSGASCR